jgi:hypothetical protein
MTRDWLAVAAGPLAWLVAHVASWMIAPGAHDAGGVVSLFVIDTVALAIAIVGGLVAARRLRALKRQPPVDRRVERARFVALCGLALSALSILLVIGLMLPLGLLVPGAEP